MITMKWNTNQILHWLGKCGIFNGVSKRRGDIAVGFNIWNYDDVIKWKHFPVSGPLWWECPRWIPLHKGQWRGDLMFSLVYAWTNIWANNRDAGDLRRHRAHYEVTMIYCGWVTYSPIWSGFIRADFQRVISRQQQNIGHHLFAAGRG